MQSYTRCTKQPKTDSSRWAKTRIQNPVRYNASGVYFARVRAGGKLFWNSLQTKVFSVAEQRLRDFVAEKRKLPQSKLAVENGRMKFLDLVRLYRLALDEDPKLKPSSKLYREKCIAALLKSWPAVADTEVRKITFPDCRTWASKFAKDYSSTVYNNSVGTLRQILEIALLARAKEKRAESDERVFNLTLFCGEVDTMW